jgi:hypothetical protein
MSTWGAEHGELRETGGTSQFQLFFQKEGRKTRSEAIELEIRRIEIMMSTQTIPVVPPAPMARFVDPDTAANYLQTTRRRLLEMVREGLIPGHPLDPHTKKKDWRFLLSELHAWMLSTVAANGRDALQALRSRTEANEVTSC